MRLNLEDKRLKWAFAIALFLHGIALAAAARLPAAPARDGSLDQITVFGEAAPTIVSPVDLVEWPPAAPARTAPRFLPQEVFPPRLLVASRHQETTPPSVPQPTSRPRPSPARAGPGKGPGRPASPAPAGGGGGGGPIDLGSPSPNGTLSSSPSGRTPVGALPGEGSGNGSGSGSGTGGGSGTGAGGGAGSGEGSSAGGGSGPGAGVAQAGGGDGGSSSFVSRVADRLEPQLLRKVAPEYPASAVEDGVEGSVRLKVLVTETGTVAEVQVTGSSGDRRLDAAARECVRRWLYRPAIQDGKPRRVYTHATVEFELK